MRPLIRSQKRISGRELEDVNIEACILAGGQSSRMGTDKAILRVGAVSMLAHVVTAAEKCGLPVRIIARDLCPPCGAIGGIYTGMRTSNCDAAIFLACDMPLVSAEFLFGLMRMLKPRQNAIFTLSRRTVGFPLLIRKRVCSHILGSIAHKNFSIQSLSRSLTSGFLHCPINRQICLLNVNTKEDLRCVQRHLVSGLHQ